MSQPKYSSKLECTMSAEDMQRREQQNEGLSLNEILSKFKIRKWNKADGKN